MKFSYDIQHSKPQLIWVDTSILIAISRVLTGKSYDQKQGENAKRLFDFLSAKVESEQALCPDGDQHYEITRGRESFLNVSSRISLGSRFKPREIIRDIQLRQFMKLHKEDCNVAELSFRDAYVQYPPVQITPTSHFKSTPSGKLDATNYFKWRDKTQSDMESLRQRVLSNNTSFQDQLEHEYRGLLEALFQTFRSLSETIESDPEQHKRDLRVLENYQRWESMWSNISRKANDIDGFVGFLLSDMIKMVPVLRIEAHLNAALLTRKAPIKTGDAMDIDHISSILPYADYLFTDKSMKALIQSLHLDSLFKCEVLYLGDADGFIESF